MRQIGTLPKGLDAKVFADHLLSLGIKARIDERPEGWEVWIYNEDHVARAREELQVYLTILTTRDFATAVPAAAAVRRKEQHLNKQFRKNFREVSDLWAAPGSAPPPSDRRPHGHLRDRLPPPAIVIGTHRLEE